LTWGVPLGIEPDSIGSQQKMAKARGIALDLVMSSFLHQFRFSH
jgi:hypothetical protein